MKLTNIDRVIQNWISLSGQENFNESDIMTHIYNAIGRLPIDYFTVKTDLIEVSDYKAILPKDFRQAIQVCGKVGEPNVQKNKVEVYGYVKKMMGGDCHIVCDCPVEDKKDCDGSCTQLDWNFNSQDLYNNSHIYYQKTKFLKEWKHPKHGSSNCNIEDKCPEYELLECMDKCDHIDKCCNVGHKSKNKYRINNCVIDTNFCKGEILLCYYAIPTEDGKPLIPDTTSVLEAISWYIEYHEMYKAMRKNIQNDTTGFYKKNQNAFQLTKIEYETWMKRARVELKTKSYLETSNFWNKHMKDIVY